MHDALSLPVLRPERLSPSQFGIVSRCPLRFLLDKSAPESDRALPSSSGARYVGTVVHRLIEAARRGRAGCPPDRAQLKGTWQAELRKSEENALANGDACWVPLTQSQRYLEQSRLWALQLASGQRVRPAHGAVATPKASQSTETEVVSGDGLIFGVIDAVELDGNELVIKDFKSGSVLDDSDQPKEIYQQQIILYAGLYHDARGRWPDRLELVDQRGTIVPVPYQQADANSLLLEAKNILVDLQAAIGEGQTTLDGDTANLARADLGSIDSPCCSCRHRPICPRHLGALRAAGLIQHGEYRYSPVDLVGRVESVAAPGDGRIRIRLRHGDQQFTVQGLTRSGTFSGEVAPAAKDRMPTPGDSVGVFSALPRRPLTDQSDSVSLMSARPTRAYFIPLPDA
jgi:RecB family exonuclease